MNATVLITEIQIKQLTTYVSQGSAATGLRRGGSFNSTFLRADPF